MCTWRCTDRYAAAGRLPIEHPVVDRSDDKLTPEAAPEVGRPSVDLSRTLPSAARSPRAGSRYSGAHRRTAGPYSARDDTGCQSGGCQYPLANGAVSCDTDLHRKGQSYDRSWTARAGKTTGTIMAAARTPAARDPAAAGPIRFLDSQTGHPDRCIRAGRRGGSSGHHHLVRLRGEPSPPRCGPSRSRHRARTRSCPRSARTSRTWSRLQASGPSRRAIPTPATTQGCTAGR